MSQIQGIRVGMDIADVQAASSGLNALLQAQAAALGNAALKMVQFNDAGRAVGAVIETIDSQGRRIVRTFETVNGILSEQNVKLIENAKLIRDSARAAAEASAAKAVTQPFIATALPNIPADIGVKLQAQIISAQNQLNKAATDALTAGLKPDEINKLLDDFRKGVVNIETGPAKDLQKAFLAVQKTIENVNKELEKTGRRAPEPEAQKTRADTAKLATTLFPAPPEGNVQKLISYSNAIIKLQESAVASKVPLADLERLMKQAAAGPQAFALELSKLPPNMQKLAKEILAVGVAAENVANTGTQAANRFTISWTSLLRILEVQLFRRAVTAVVNNIQAGIAAAQTYEIKLAQVANVAGQSGPQIEQLATRVRGLSEAYGIANIQVLTAAQVALTSQTGNAAAGFQVLEQAMRLSVATGTDLQSSTRLITTSLEAFGLQAADAARVSEVLYQASQRTRIPLEEMKNAIGRAGAPARALGLDIEQVTAIFLSFAQSGRRPTEAFSLLTQVMGRLLSPTKELQDLLNSMGTPTAEIAIATQGFGGFLARLNSIAQDSPERLGDLTGSIRQLNAFLGVTGDNAIKIEQNFRTLIDGTRTLSEGVQTTLATPAQQLRIEYEKLKNVFEKDVGLPIIKVSNTVLQAFNGLEGGVRAIVEGVKLAAVAFLTYRAAVLASQIQMGSWAAVSTLATTAVSKTMIDLKVAAAAALTSTPVVLTIAVVGFFAASQYLSELDRRASDIRLRSLERDQAATTAIQESIAASSRDAARELGQDVNNAFTRPLQSAAAALQAAKDFRDQVVQQSQEAQAGLRAMTQGFLDGLRDRVRTARSEIQQAEADIRSSQRRVALFQEQTARRRFETALGVEQDPLAGLQLIQQRRSALEREVEGLFRSAREAENTDLARPFIEAAQGRIQELGRLNQEEQRRQQEVQRIRFEQDITAGQVQPEIDAFGRRRYVLRVNLLELDRESLRTQQLEARLESERQANLARAIQERERQVSQQVQLTRTLEGQFRTLTQFRAFNAEGQLVERFRDLERQRPGSGLEAARAQLESIAQNIFRTIETQAGGANIQQLQQAQQVIAQIRLSLESEFRSQERVNAAQAHQRRLTQIREEFTERSRLLEAERSAAESARVGAAQAADAQLQEIRAAVTRTAIAPTDILGINVIGGADLAARRVGGGRTAEEIFIRDFPRALNEARSALAVYQREVNDTNRVAAEGAIERAREIARHFDRNRIPTTTNPLQIQTQGRRSVDEALTEAINQIRAVQQQDRSLAERDQQLVQLRNRITEVAAAGNAIPESMRIAAIATGESIRTNIVNNFEQAGSQVQALIRQITDLQAAIRNTPRLQVGGNGLGGNIPEFARGGQVFGPRGTDTQLGWLTPGEIVMNLSASNRWRTQLLTMNRGIEPRYYARGGTVTNNNIGDIHLNVTAGQATSTVRDMGRQLRREIRRGTLDLS